MNLREFLALLDELCPLPDGVEPVWAQAGIHFH